MAAQSVKKSPAKKSTAKRSGKAKKAVDTRVKVRSHLGTPRSGGVSDPVADFVRAVATNGRQESNLRDPFSHFGQGQIVTPPYDPLILSMQPEFSDILEPVLQALVTNIEWTGYDLVPINAKVDIESEQALMENERFDAFLSSCTERGLFDIRNKFRRDFEMTGNAYLEILREKRVDADRRAFTEAVHGLGRDDKREWSKAFRNAEDDAERYEVVRSVRAEAGTGGVVDTFGDDRQPWHMVHAPSFTMRIVNQSDEERAPVLTYQYRKSIAGWQKIPIRRSFRKFVQIIDGNMSTQRYFKEFGDPRGLDVKTGEYYDTPDDVPVDEKTGESMDATEIQHFRYYVNDRTPYGITPFIGVISLISGAYKANLVNFNTFDNNAIPGIMLMIAGAVLDQETVDRIRDDFERFRDTGDRNGLMIIEAVSDAMDSITTANATQTKMSIERLTDQIQSDAHFLKYLEQAHNMVMAARRVPPILAGLEANYNFATAKTARIMFEQQVASQERKRFDDFLNLSIAPRIGVDVWTFRSKPADIRDPDDLNKIINAMVNANVGNQESYNALIKREMDIDMPVMPEYANMPPEIAKRFATIGALSRPGETEPVVPQNRSSEIALQELSREVIRTVQADTLKAEQLGLFDNGVKDEEKDG